MACRTAGIGYCAAGGLTVGGLWTAEDSVKGLCAAIQQTERTFTSVQLISNGVVDFQATRVAAACIVDIARTTQDGFGNLRFAATANCPPHIPFFPAAYHAGQAWRFSVALEAADLVLAALDGEDSLTDAERRLLSEVEAVGQSVEHIARSLEEPGIGFAGTDLSPAPYPSDDVSVAGGLERLGLERFGAAGTLFACWRLTSALKRAEVLRAGFSGAMLPVLEDSVLAERAAQGLYSVGELLLFSAVCGTGLDTVPLPGDVSESELAAILLDVGALSAGLDKPLTARLFPVPGKRAGDATSFNFPFFANSRVLATKGYGADRLLARGW
jgi:uncharacterized protein (UPF0210 family)